MKDELFGNKVFGAILGALLLLFALRQVSEMVFATHPPKVAGDKIAIQEAAGDAGVVADTPPDWGTVLPTADVAAGATVANKCKACHNLDNGGPNQTGPNLWGVIGRKHGTHPGFAYSSGMTDFGNKIGKWSFAEVYKFLAGPQADVSGTKMTFVGLKQRQDRINLIAWLRQQSSSPEPIPAPDPKAAAAAKAPAGAAAGTAPAPQPGSGVPDAAAGAGAKAPTAAAKGAPATSQTASPEAPTTGAAAAPNRTDSTSPGGAPK